MRGSRCPSYMQGREPAPGAGGARAGRLARGGVSPLLDAQGRHPQRLCALRHSRPALEADPLVQRRARPAGARGRGTSRPNGSCSTAPRTRWSCSTYSMSRTGWTSSARCWAGSTPRWRRSGTSRGTTAKPRSGDAARGGDRPSGQVSRAAQSPRSHLQGMQLGMTVHGRHARQPPKLRKARPSSFKLSSANIPLWVKLRHGCDKGRSPAFG